jgi:hypothetical protein
MFKHLGGESIKTMCPDCNGVVQVVKEVGEFAVSFNEVWSRFGMKAPGELVEILRAPDTAWSKARIRDGCDLGGFIDDFYIKRDGLKLFGDEVLE